MPFDGTSFERPRRERAPSHADQGPGVVTWAVSFACVILPFLAAALCIGLH